MIDVFDYDLTGEEQLRARLISYQLIVYTTDRKETVAFYGQ